MKALALFGSTGSIGTQTLDVVRSQSQRLKVTALAARASWEALAEQAREFRPAVVGLADERFAAQLQEALPQGVALVTGPTASVQIASEASYDLAVHGVVGAEGARVSHAVLDRGVDLALANKESLVVAGDLLMELARVRGARILPVDSEHAAIDQCLRGERMSELRRLLITASGGPFRDRPLDTFDTIRVDEALRHPTWEMGRRITIGSATLMNKALEVIEAGHLFGVTAERVDVVLHRESVVHSMCEFIDGSVIAQMGAPDMRHPIHYALFAPERVEAPLPGYDVKTFARLSFEDVDPERYPALELGYRALRDGGAAGCVLNAADEVAVEAFLDGELAFRDIARLNAEALDATPSTDGRLDDLLRIDLETRAWARKWVRGRGATV